MNFLDLAESDLMYTHGLMTKGEASYEGKEILILGGGDGALLWELLKEKPKFVTMIDVSYGDILFFFIPHINKTKERSFQFSFIIPFSCLL